MSFSKLRTASVCATSILIATGLVACGESEVVDSAATTHAAAEGKTNYPLTIENCGETVTIDQAPTRVFSLDQGSTEILLSLGLENIMVGTSGWTDPVLESLSEANESVKRVADNDPSYEAVMDTNPDFITASFGRHYRDESGVATRERLSETGVGSYLSPTDCDNGVSINAGGTRTTAVTPQVIYDEISQLAEIFDVQDRGAQLISDLQARADAALKDLPQTDQSVAFWFADLNAPYMAGGLGAPALLSNETGLANVFGDVDDEWPAVRWEDIVDRDPDILVLGDLSRDKFSGDKLADKKDFLANDPVTSTMDAVKNERYIALHGAEMNPSIRFVDGLEKIAAFLKEQDSSSNNG